MQLAETISRLPIVDHHAHPLLRWEVAQASPYSAAFTEGYHARIVSYHARHALFYRRSLKDMARLLGCGAEEHEVQERRHQLGLDELSRLCFQASKVERLLLDDGLMPDQILELDWHRRFLPSQRILRIEQLAESLLGQCDDFVDFRNRFRQGLEAPVVAYKSIIAYRTGLAIEPVALGQARDAYRRRAEGTSRLQDKTLLDFLVAETLQVAAERELPLQLHTGFGDPDLDLSLSNPLLLRQLITQHPTARLVLLHAGYPFTRETGFLASVYPNVYADFGLAIPFLSVRGMAAALRELLELAPFSKVLYSSDASRIPDLFYLGALWGRKVVAEVMQSFVDDGELNLVEAEQYARWLLADNARVLYPE